MDQLECGCGKRSLYTHHKLATQTSVGAALRGFQRVMSSYVKARRFKAKPLFAIDSRQVLAHQNLGA